MKKNTWGYMAIAAVLFYVFAVVLGDVLRADYNAIGFAISELIESGAPNKGLLDIFFVLYNLFTGLFAFFWLKQVGSNRLARAGVIVLLIEALTGLLIALFFPMDPRGSQSTFAGVMHLVLSGVASLTTMIAVGLIAAWLRAAPATKGLSIYSFITLVVIFVSGGSAAASAASASPIMGLLERITIGAFMQWLLVMGWVIANGRLSLPARSSS